MPNPDLKDKTDREILEAILEEMTHICYAVNRHDDQAPQPGSLFHLAELIYHRAEETKSDVTGILRRLEQP